MSSKELYTIREWAPVNLDQIPTSIMRGFFSVDVQLTCIDAIENFLALGSDVGIVFWYNREKNETQKLRAETSSRITCVKIVDSVEYMIAAGSANGQVSVFQIQKPLPADLKFVRRVKPIERYTIRELHSTPVSCCEWSKNGMKLYSGDRQGVVVLTEFDYQAHQSKSQEILSEAYEIVQLSVHQCYLLVSTLYRSIVCQRNLSTGQWHITQIGKKDRKQLIDCGGIFVKRNAKKPQLIVGRPGLRFWLADTEGNVEKTLLFRDAVALSPTWEIPILNPKTKQTQKPKENIVHDSPTQDFGKNFRNFYLYAGQDTLLVTHDEVKMYILNLDRLRVEAVACGFRKLLDFCVCDKEIFVLEGERSLVRLAPLPEKPNKMAQIIFNPKMPPPLPMLGAAAAGIFESPVEYEPEEQTIVSAEECFELPAIETLNLNIPIELAVESPRAEQNRRLQIFNKIGTMDFEESIVHRSGLLLNGRAKRKSKSSERKNFATGIIEIGQVAKTFEDATTTTATTHSASHPQTTKPTLMDLSFCTTTNSDHVELPSLPHLSPIAAEEFERAQALASLANLNLLHGPGIENFQPTLQIESPKSLTQQQESQQQQKLQDAVVQTTPSKKQYNNIEQHEEEEEAACGDYSAGQPVDEILQALHAINFIEDIENVSVSQQQQQQHEQQQQLQQQKRKFLAAQPVLEEINSFLPDFNRISDPKIRNSPPPSGGSGTSSEWEILDS